MSQDMIKVKHFDPLSKKSGVDKTAHLNELHKI